MHSAAAPVLKWAGGKRQLLSKILPALPARIRTYYEPFVGGGAVFFALAGAGRFQSAVLGDANAALVNLYRQLRDNVDGVIGCLRAHSELHSEEHFYAERPLLNCSPGAENAARLVYLNRTCFNGLYRVNKSGGFNVPFGRYAHPRILDAAGLLSASSALRDVEIVHGDFAALASRAETGDAVYFDPPYVPASKTANFTAYHQSVFGVADHERLALSAGEAVARGASVLLSNSDTPETRRIFSAPDWDLESVAAKRNINCLAGGRGSVGEILASAQAKFSRTG